MIVWIHYEVPFGFLATPHAPNYESGFGKDARQIRSVLSLACEEITSYGKRPLKLTFKADVACKQRSINWATTFLDELFRIGSKSFIRKRENSITALSSSTQSTSKIKAVYAMRQPKRSVISVAREYAVSRQTLYAWNKEIPNPCIGVPEPIMTPP